MNYSYLWSNRLFFFVLSCCTVSPIPACFCWTVDRSNYREETPALQGSDGDQPPFSLFSKYVFVYTHMGEEEHLNHRCPQNQTPVQLNPCNPIKSSVMFVKITSLGLYLKCPVIKYWNYLAINLNFDHLQLDLTCSVCLFIRKQSTWIWSKFHFSYFAFFAFTLQYFECDCTTSFGQKLTYSFLNTQFHA